MRLEGKNILITGSNRGIGLALAKEAALYKMNIHMLCRGQDEKIKEELIQLGSGAVTYWELDLSHSQAIDKFIEKFRAAKVSPDLLINNAGQLTGGLLEDQKTDDIYKMIQVNLIGLIHLTKGLLPIMLKLKEAKIVNNASVSGIFNLPCASTYSASKAGVVAFTESLRNELEGTSVSTLTLITPGVKTRMFDQIYEDYRDHMDLKFLNSIASDVWAKRVFQHIKKDKTICWPEGKDKMAVLLGQHFPSLFGKLMRTYFKR